MRRPFLGGNKGLFQSAGRQVYPNILSSLPAAFWIEIPNKRALCIFKPRGPPSGDAEGRAARGRRPLPRGRASPAKETNPTEGAHPPPRPTSGHRHAPPPCPGANFGRACPACQQLPSALSHENGGGGERIRSSRPEPCVRGLCSPAVGTGHRAPPGARPSGPRGPLLSAGSAPLPRGLPPAGLRAPCRVHVRACGVHAWARVCVCTCTHVCTHVHAHVCACA